MLLQFIIAILLVLNLLLIYRLNAILDELDNKAVDQNMLYMKTLQLFQDCDKLRMSVKGIYEEVFNNGK